jgi:ADP-ribosylglycohydrolase
MESNENLGNFNDAKGAIEGVTGRDVGAGRLSAADTLAQLTRLAQASQVADRIIGMIMGHALGDAVGLITEYSNRNTTTPVVFPYTTSIRNYPPCDWTDDTDQMIVVMQCLIANDLVLNVKDIAERLRTWANYGFPELGDTQGAGLNGMTSAVISRPCFVKSSVNAAAEIWEASKRTFALNGSLTRTSILGALPTRGVRGGGRGSGCIQTSGLRPHDDGPNDPTSASQTTRELSYLTHIDNRCVMACDLQTSIIHLLIHRGHWIKTPRDINDLLDGGVKVTRILSGAPGAGNQQYATGSTTIASIVDVRTRIALAKDVPDADRELSECIRIAYTSDISALQLDGRPPSVLTDQNVGGPGMAKSLDVSKNVGHVFEALGCSIYMLQTIKISLEHDMTPSFKKCIIRVAQEGGDADANAALAGATLGAYLGYSQLPHDWLANMPFFPWLAEIVTQFVGLVCRDIPAKSEIPNKLVGLFHRIDTLMPNLNKDPAEIAVNGSDAVNVRNTLG